MSVAVGLGIFCFDIPTAFLHAFLHPDEPRPAIFPSAQYDSRASSAPRLFLGGVKQIMRNNENGSSNVRPGRMFYPLPTGTRVTFRPGLTCDFVALHSVPLARGPQMFGTTKAWFLEFGGKGQPRSYLFVL